jgi:hypothetical protein
MKVKRTLMLAVTFCGMSIAGTPVEDNVQNLSLGYQGMINGEFLQGVSLRSWRAERKGWEINLYHAFVDIEYGSSDVDGQLLLLEGKYLHGLKIRDNSRFYFGLSGGLGQAWSSDADDDLEIYWARPLIGAEYFFNEIPEIGFNFEVGYGYSGFSIDEDSLQLIGIGVNLGVHYYF